MLPLPFDLDFDDRGNALLKKFLASAAVTVSVLAGVGLTAGTASAASDQGAPSAAPGGVYPSAGACFDAGHAGVAQHRWQLFHCDALGGGQYELWVAG